MDVENSWFSVSYGAIRYGMVNGLESIFGSLWQKLLIIGTIVICILFSLKSTDEKRPDKLTLQTYLFIIGCCVAPLVLALAISFLTNPIFSERIFLISMPFYWVLIGMVSSTLMARLSKTPAVIVTAISLLIFLTVSIARFFDHEIPPKESWRDSAAFIRSQSACKNAAIPVVDFEQPAVSVGDINITYAYYLNDHDAGFFKIPMRKSFDNPAQAPYRELVKARLSDATKCPILVWTVHHWPISHLEAFVADIRKSNSLPEGRHIVVKEFSGDAFIVIVK